MLRQPTSPRADRTSAPFPFRRLPGDGCVPDPAIARHTIGGPRPGFERLRGWRFAALELAALGLAGSVWTTGGLADAMDRARSRGVAASAMAASSNRTPNARSSLIRSSTRSRLLMPRSRSRESLGPTWRSSETPRSSPTSSRTIAKTCVSSSAELRAVGVDPRSDTGPLPS